MTEQQLREKVAAKARSWEGMNESDGSHHTIIDIYNSVSPIPRGYKMPYDKPWCATYVSAVGYSCGMSRILHPECGCGQMIALYQACGEWMEDDNFVPQIGDLMFFYWRDDGRGDCHEWPQHVGIVVGVDIVRGVIITMEGNHGGAVKPRETPIGGKYIRGFACPDYASLSLPDWESEWPTAMKNCERAGIMDGTRPMDAVTRRELAVVLDRLGLTGGA